MDVEADRLVGYKTNSQQPGWLLRPISMISLSLFQQCDIVVWAYFYQAVFVTSHCGLFLLDWLRVGCSLYVAVGNDICIVHFAAGADKTKQVHGVVHGA